MKEDKAQDEMDREVKIDHSDQPEINVMYCEVRKNIVMDPPHLHCTMLFGTNISY